MKVDYLICILLFPCIVFAQKPQTVLLDLNFDEVADDGQSPAYWRCNTKGREINKPCFLLGAF
ncbi:MAG: hypothetical protein ACI94D_002005, partial [Neolewinella sp.]|jgi:hypothetical protein